MPVTLLPATVTDVAVASVSALFHHSKSRLSNSANDSR